MQGMRFEGSCSLSDEAAAIAQPPQVDEVSSQTENLDEERKYNFCNQMLDSMALLFRLTTASGLNTFD